MKLFEYLTAPAATNAGMPTSSSVSVRVAIRIRPFNTQELAEGAQKCINKVLSQPQVTVGTDSFTYDYVFDENDRQNVVYDNAVAKITCKIFKGYNVTLLAYGQVSYSCLNKKK